MSKREKIIVGIMMIALIVGGYFYLSSPEGPAGLALPKNPSDELDQFVMNIVSDLTSTDRTALDDYIIGRALERWTEDVFRKEVQPTVKTSEAAVLVETENAPGPGLDLPPLQYSGYLKIGEARLAVINGQEYAIGEKIEPGGAVLVDILPTAAVVHFSAENEKITLPLRELE